MRRPRQKLWFVLLSTAVTLVAPPHGLRAQNRPLRDVIDAETSAVWKRENVAPYTRLGYRRSLLVAARC